MRGGRGEETGGVEIVHGAEDFVDLGITNQYHKKHCKRKNKTPTVFKAVHK